MSPATDLVITRIVNAPRELVWRAWTEPEHLMKWWGPKVFTSPLCKVDFRVGGAYLFGMRSPDGQEFWSTGTYKEIIPLEKIVYTDFFSDNSGKIMTPAEMGLPGDDWSDERTVTVTFEDSNGKTKLTMRHHGLPSGVMQDMANQGWSGSFDKLEESVSNPYEQEPTVTGKLITAKRIFNAPQELVYQMWTDPKHVVNWWGPKGFKNTIQEMDVRPGGTWEFVMHGPDGVDYKNKIVYVEVEKPNRLVYDHVSKPFFRHTVTFEKFGKLTRVSIHAEFESAEILEQTIKVFNALEGLLQTMNRLAELLQTM